ncbi:Vacuolar amino acid transporter 5 [Smittium mucronatum]|uniref:Vacuolar amino acid transporter 5 n=1 Tax=Smittium mucronatum TaxID=133383 RepID=A0A1R0H9E7_9FUNG|nr:Vacuolar amino acid transporter 5 [Smittium mucronatum]
MSQAPQSSSQNLVFNVVRGNPLHDDIRNNRFSTESAVSGNVPIYDFEEHTGTITSSTINLCNTILGAGLLAMPFAVSKVGLFLGLALVVFSGMTSGLGLYLLAKCAEKVPLRKSSFFSVSELTYPKAGIFFDLAVAIKCFVPVNLSTSFCRMSVAIFVVSAYPLQMHPARASVGRVIYSLFPKLSHSQFSPILPSQNTSSIDENVPTSENNDNNNRSSSQSHVSYAAISRANGSSEQPQTLDVENNQNHDAQKLPELSNVNRDLSNNMFFGITSTLLVTSYLLAASVKSLGLVLVLVGSTGSTTISFILPGLMYLKINENRKLDTRKVLAGALAGYGILVMFVSLFEQIF